MVVSVTLSRGALRMAGADPAEQHPLRHLGNPHPAGQGGQRRCPRTPRAGHGLRAQFHAGDRVHQLPVRLSDLLHPAGHLHHPHPRQALAQQAPSPAHRRRPGGHRLRCRTPLHATRPLLRLRATAGRLLPGARRAGDRLPPDGGGRETAFLSLAGGLEMMWGGGGRHHPERSGAAWPNTSKAGTCVHQFSD